MQLQNQCRVCILIAVMVNQIKIENTTQKGWIPAPISTL